jgi:hypothetical protein
MQLQVLRLVVVDMPQVGKKLLMSVSELGLGEYRSVGDVLGGKQRGGTLTHIIRRHPSTYPNPMGSIGWVRSKAWHWLFSSTHNTMASSGGFKYKSTRMGRWTA